MKYIDGHLLPIAFNKPQFMSEALEIRVDMSLSPSSPSPSLAWSGTLFSEREGGRA